MNNMKLKTAVLLIGIFLISAPAFSQQDYIALSTKEYNDSPVIIKNAFIRDDNGNGLRAYFDIEYNNSANISLYTLWLTIYYENDDTPELLEYKNSPNGSDHIVWDLKSNGKIPVSGMIVPYTVEMKNGASWNLKDFYSMPVDLDDNNENSSRGNRRGRVGRSRIETPPAGTRRNTMRGRSRTNSNVPHPEWDREMDAALVTDKPKIDGNLDDAIWQNTEFQSDFLQREPEEGIPASEKTEVAIL
ncbi:MAG: hypothetical protein GY863_17545, partial [bacterium]|nr:hypothetical protein [bacterium]